MSVIEVLLLLLVAGLLAFMSWRDRQEYIEFSLVTDTLERQRTVRRWILVSFLLFGVTSLVGLALLGRFNALLDFPAEFASLADDIRRLLAESGVGAGFLAGAVGAIIAGIFLGVVLRKRQQRENMPSELLLGDVDPLRARNAEERRWTTVLAINAGFSEELFFRLFLPLLVVEVTGNAIVAFILAALAFGMAHYYQGWVGVVATIGLGAVMTAIYLATGTIWAPVVVHALIDFSGLVFRPWLRERAGQRPTG
ncbi:MAG: CPBP family intramembrane glutamic endopeptidase [Bauldia sp.]